MIEKINKFRNAPERTVLTFTFSENIGLYKQGNVDSVYAQGRNNNSDSRYNCGSGSKGGQCGCDSSQSSQGANNTSQGSQGENNGNQSSQSSNGASRGSQGTGYAYQGGQSGDRVSQSSSFCGCSSGGASGSIQCSHTLKVRLCDAVAVLIGAKIVFYSLMLLKCKLGK